MLPPIGICANGPLAGKGTVAGFIREWADEHDWTFHERGYADYGKLSFARQFFPNIDMAGAIAWCDQFKVFGHVDVFTEDPWLDRNQNPLSLDINGRTMIRQFLTEGGRDIHGPTVWTDLLMGDVAWRRKEFNRAQVCVISDVRFSEEVDAILANMGGQIWKVVRDEATDTSGHDSEAGIPDSICAAILDNNGTPDELRDQVRGLLPSSLPQ